MYDFALTIMNGVLVGLFYGAIAYGISYLMIFLYALFICSPGIDPATTPEWIAKEKAYFDQRDENGELNVPNDGGSNE